MVPDASQKHIRKTPISIQNDPIKTTPSQKNDIASDHILSKKPHILLHLNHLKKTGHLITIDNKTHEFINLELPQYTQDKLRRDNFYHSHQHIENTFHHVLPSHNEQYILLKDQLLSLNRTGKIEHIQRCAYMKANSDMAILNHSLFISSSEYGSILIFDSEEKRIVKGYHLKHNTTANCLYLAPFDPSSDIGPPPQQKIGLNTLFIQGNRLYFSCTHFQQLFYAEANGALHTAFSIPSNTQYVRSYKTGIIWGNDIEQTIEYVDLNGTPIEQFSYPSSPASSYRLKYLTSTENDLIIAIFSSDLIAIYQPGCKTPIKIQKNLIIF